MMSDVIQFPTRGGEIGEPRDDARWRVDIEYRSEEGGQFACHFIEEIADLHEIIEQGPHFDTIVKCVITVNRQSGDIPRLTKEQAVLL
jgi:hypothetical protein